MVKIKKGDFLELDYIGKLTNGQVFDLTNRDDAEKFNLLDKNAEYKPRIICIGENEILKPIDDFLIGKDTGKSYTLEIKKENTKWKRDSSLIKVINSNALKQQNIKPYPGMSLVIDNLIARVVSVSGGRLVVDFNHPLADKDVVYELRPLKIVDDVNEKLKAVMFSHFSYHENIEFKNGKVTLFNIPKEFQDKVEKRLKELVKEVKTVEFKEKK
ncbi:FKBP-type peptidyl-prolyl cis-trans isomerase [Candidatus Woesearchaeota archaeon]|nr:FKBP-type peptidyl-prolyl cis-trans isomerase [Candidatus Woesearchaeota archaeon]